MKKVGARGSEAAEQGRHRGAAEGFRREVRRDARALDEAFIAEVITFRPGAEPPSRTRFDMLLAAKEHEMHHRAQLMLMERMIGIVPHLTRASQERMARFQQQQNAQQAQPTR